MQRVVKRQSRIDVCFLLKILYESEGITFMSCDDSLLHPVLLVRVCVCVCVHCTWWAPRCGRPSACQWSHSFFLSFSFWLFCTAYSRILFAIFFLKLHVSERRCAHPFEDYFSSLSYHV